MRALIPVCAAALALFAAACHSTHTFATPDTAWKSHIGQLKFSNPQRTLIGEIVVQRRGTQDFQLDFLKGGSFPLISIREDATVARTEGALARGRWQGSPRTAPKALRPWLALREAFAQPQASPAGATTPWRGQSTTENGQLSTLTLAFPEDQQRFVFQFNH